MRVEYELIEYPYLDEKDVYGNLKRVDRHTETKILHWNTCCDTMREFSADGFPLSSHGGYLVLTRERYGVGDYDRDETFYYNIHHCPFCGEAIAYIQVRRLKAVPQMKEKKFIERVTEEKEVKKTVFVEWKFEEVV